MKQRAPQHDLSGALVSRRSFLAGAVALSLAMGVKPIATAAGRELEDGVFELRQYTLYGGRRDTLISLFEKNFIESQEAVGAHVIGTFCDLDDPDRFVWIRGFRDMPARQEALEAFYGSSSAWRTHKTEANATMVDSDNVLLLRAISSSGLRSAAAHAPGTDAVYGMTIYYLGAVDTNRFADFFDTTILPRIRAAGVEPLATLATNEVPNNFPRLPVRDHDRVFLWMGRWSSRSDQESFSTQLKSWSGWRMRRQKRFFPP